MNVELFSNADMKRARYKFEDKIWAVRNAKGKNLSDIEGAREATEHLKEKEPDFTGEVSINVFRGWKRLKWESDLSHECMSSKKKLVYKYPFLETGLLHFLKLLTDPSRTGNYKKVKYTCAAVKRAAIQVKNSTLLVLQKSLWWKDLMEGLLPKGAKEGIEKIERFSASDKWCIRMLESIMKEERLKENCLSFVQFKNLQIGAEMFQECLGRAVLKVLEDMHLDTTTLLPLKDAKQVERLGELRYLKWNGLVINFSELRAIQDTGRMCSSTMYLYCAEMARRGNEKNNGLWVMPPSLLCAVLDMDSSLARMRIEEIVTKTGIEADFQLTKSKGRRKVAVSASKSISRWF